ncbi:hypothetical protein GOODEAATRI_032344 [Goodea atripinnis]|uniref:Uncharacterized protein n=1 Tax=Goodea atripinnis TaxID=208336 RepID=A0ABV0N606_9TELE
MCLFIFSYRSVFPLVLLFSLVSVFSVQFLMSLLFLCSFVSGSGLVFVYFVLATCVQCFRWCWSSQVCWVTGATYSTDYLEEYLSRRLPVLRRHFHYTTGSSGAV